MTLGLRRTFGSSLLTDPATIADLYAGYTATSGVSSGAAWNDISGHGRHLTQTTSGNQPVYTAVDTDGKPSVSFNGVNQWLLASSFSLPGDPAVTTFLVCSPASVAASAYLSPFGWGNGSGSGQAHAILFNYPGAAQPGLQTGGGNGVTFVANLTTGTQQFTWQKTAGALGATTTERKNGAAVAQSGTAATTTPNYSTGTLYVGVFANSSAYFFSGKIRELLIYNRALTTTEIAQIEAYLANKWTLS